MKLSFWPFKVDSLKHDNYVCILASMRTGSNLLQSYINTCEQAICLGELFNPHFVGVDRPDVGKNMFAGFSRTDVKERDADKRVFFNSMHKAAYPKTLAFRLFSGHNSSVLDSVLDNTLCKKIILTRNSLDSFISLEIARKTDQWLLKDPKTRKLAQVEFSPENYSQYVEKTARFYNALYKRIDESGQSYFKLDYSDLNNLARINEALSFIGSNLCLDALPSKLVRQNPASLEEKVTNFKVMREFVESRNQEL